MMTPKWSADGEKIIATATINEQERIYIMNPDGSGLQPLTPPDIRAIHGSWSSDSKQVIFCADDDAHPPKKNDTKIYSIDVDSGRVRTLISGGVNTYPSWSPDMKKIVFRKIIGDMNSEVFVASSNGTNLRNITNNPAFDGWPAWSPDGKWIAFASNMRPVSATSTNLRVKPSGAESKKTTQPRAEKNMSAAQSPGVHTENRTDGQEHSS
jgi:TolB protein